jgi:hypothetical protein
MRNEQGILTAEELNEKFPEFSVRTSDGLTRNYTHCKYHITEQGELFIYKGQMESWLPDKLKALYNPAHWVSVIYPD